MAGNRSIIDECLAEVVGTFILVFFGVGIVHTAVLTGAQLGLWVVAAVWGVAVSLAIYSVGAVSGAHLNPAMTVAFAAFRGFPKRKVAPYILSQVIGAFLAAAVLYTLFHGVIIQFETAHDLVRGAAGSELSGMIYGEYFPNPGMIGTAAGALAEMTVWQAMLAELMGTAFLCFFIFAITDDLHPRKMHSSMFAILIGVALAIIIAIIAPLTQAGLNPARDFGPRLFAYFAGWGSIAIPGPQGGFFTVYILAPIIGALIGATVYQRVIRTALQAMLAREEPAPAIEKTVEGPSADIAQPENAGVTINVGS